MQFIKSVRSKPKSNFGLVLSGICKSHSDYLGVGQDIERERWLLSGVHINSKVVPKETFDKGEEKTFYAKLNPVQKRLSSRGLLLVI